MGRATRKGTRGYVGRSRAGSDSDGGEVGLNGDGEVEAGRRCAEGARYECGFGGGVWGVVGVREAACGGEGAGEEA